MSGSCSYLTSFLLKFVPSKVKTQEKPRVIMGDHTSQNGKSQTLEFWLTKRETIESSSPLTSYNLEGHNHLTPPALPITPNRCKRKDLIMVPFHNLKKEASKLQVRNSIPPMFLAELNISCTWLNTTLVQVLSNRSTRSMRLDERNT